MRSDLRGQIEQALYGIDASVGVAVSGGGDSMALLHLAIDRARHLGAHAPHALTVNHNLRPAAADEAAFVAQSCATLGVPHDTLNWSDWDGTGNVQAAAREGRYRVLADFARTNGLNTILLGHTADDIAETFLMRIARGSGVEGLSAMQAGFTRHGVTFLRPLLNVKREVLRAYLRDGNHLWIEDPSNEDPRFTRVQMRQLLPLIQDAGLTVSQLSATAARLSDAQDVVMQSVRSLVADVGLGADGTLTVPSASLERALPETRRQFWAKTLQWMGNAAYPPRTEAIAQAIERARVEGRAQVGGCDIFVTDSGFRLLRELKAVAAVTSTADGLWDGKWAVTGANVASFNVRALGETGLQACPNWRDTGRERTALLATPAVFQGDRLIAAPLAGVENGWAAQIVADLASYVAGH